MYVGRPEKLTILTAIILSTVKHKSGSVMVWAAMSWNSLSPIVGMHCRINSKDYLNILRDHVSPMVQALFMIVTESSKTTMLRYIPLIWLRIGTKSMKLS